MKSEGDKKQIASHFQNSVSITQIIDIYDEHPKCILSSILFPILWSHSGDGALMKEETHFWSTISYSFTVCEFLLHQIQSGQPEQKALKKKKIIAFILKYK